MKPWKKFDASSDKFVHLDFARRAKKFVCVESHLRASNDFNARHAVLQSRWKIKTPAARPQPLGRQTERTFSRSGAVETANEPEESGIAIVEKDEQRRPRPRPLRRKIGQRRLQESSRWKNEI
jgi:hypothetical protein